MNKAVNVEEQKEEVTVVNANEDTGGMLGDDLTEAERAYFESGGQDVSGLLNDNNYKEDAARAQQRAEENPSADPAQADPAIDRGQQADPTTAAKEPGAEATPPADGQEVNEDEDFDFDNLRVGPDGRLRDPNGKFVPLKALQRERERFKSQRDTNSTLEEQNRKLQEDYTRLSERLNTLQEIWTKPQENTAEQKKTEEKPKGIVEQILEGAGEAPDPETDVFAHAKWLSDLNKKQFEALQRLEERLESSTAEIREKDIAPVREQLTENEKINYYRQDASNFAQANKNFADAYKHLITQRHATLALTGFTDANQRMQQIQREERELVDLALQQNQRPAEFIYNYAVATGYRPPAVDPTPAQDTTAPAAQPNGQAAPTQQAPAQQAPAQVPGSMSGDAAQKLINAQNAQNATGTLSGSGGAAAETLTAEAIANMTDEQFLALHQQLGAGKMKTFLSGRG